MRTSNPIAKYGTYYEVHLEPVLALSGIFQGVAVDHLYHVHTDYRNQTPSYLT